MKHLILILAAVCPLLAAEKHPLPKDLPAYGTTQPLRPPDVRESRLPNGMTVWLVPRPGFPKVAFTLAIRGGYTADPKDRPGFADLLAGALTQGTSSHSAREIAEQIAAAGGDLSTDSVADAIFVETSVLNSKAADALKLVSEVARSAAFADQEVEIAKNNLASGLEASEADPSFLARRALYREVFGSHPYSVISPTKESLAAISAADLRREFARRFRPDRALLVVVGDFTEQSLMPSVHASFDSWKATGEAAPIAGQKPQPSVSKTVVYVPRANSVQTTLYLGALGPNRADGDYAATRLANALYGGMFGSRLTSNIREDKGYTYSPGARLSPLRETGLMATRADVRNEVTGASFNEIAYELNRMATTAPEEQEVESARRYILGSMALGMQSRQGVSRTLANLWIDGLPATELAHQNAELEKVKPADVERVSRKYFPVSRMTVIAVGDEQVIKQQLAPFGLEFRKSN